MNNEKGVSLIIAFFIITIMLAIVLGIGTILFREVKIISNIGNSISSSYAAHSGVEKTLYFDRKVIPDGANRGFCNLCKACGKNSCNNCDTFNLARDGSNGCDVNSCNNCRITYNSTFNNRTYRVDAKVTPNSSNPSLFDFYINSKGSYKNTTRVVEFQSTQ